MRSIPVLDYTSTLTGSPLPDIIDGNGTVQESSQTYTMVNGDTPTLMYRYVFIAGTGTMGANLLPVDRLFAGTPVLYIDLVTVNATLGFQPTIIKRGHKKNSFSGYHWMNRNSTTWGTFSSVPVVGNLYEADYLQRK